MSNVCLIMTDPLRELYNKILQKYPEECAKIGFNEGMFLGWVESYQNAYNKPSDFVPKMESLINLVEKNRNKDGKSIFNTIQAATEGVKNSNSLNPAIFSRTLVPQLIEHLKASGINMFDRTAMDKFFKEHPNTLIQQALEEATDNNGMFSTENDDIQMAIDRFVNKSSLPKGELSTLSSALMTKYGNKTAYGDVIQTANYEYYVNYKGAGEFDIIEYHQLDNNKYERINDKENRGFRGSIDRVSSGDEFTKDKYPIHNYDVANRETAGNNADLDKRTSQGESQQTQNNGDSQEYQGRSIRLSKTGADGTNFPRVIEVDDILAFITPQGEIYGFVDKDGNMYFDETIIDASHPIHEYTHLWDRVLAKNNPELWNKGVKLMQEGASGLWNEIVNSENYGKLWQSQGIKGDKLINLIASEVHARLVGDNGAKLLDQIAKEQGNDSIIAKLKQWILDAWKELKATFSNWSQEEIDKLTLKDFNHMTVRDFADGINPNTVSSPSNAIPASTPATASVNPFDAVLDVNTADAVPSGSATRAFENQPKPERPKSVAYESALNTKDSRVAKFKRTFSPQQIKDRGAMISNIFSRIIDEYLWDTIGKQLDIIEDDTKTEQQKNDAREILHKLKDPVTGRQFAAQSKQLSEILQEIRQELQNDLDYAIQYNAGEQKIKLLQNLLEYNPDYYGDGSKEVYDAFSMMFNTQATLDIEEREGIRIIGLEMKQSTSEDNNDTQDDGDDDVGHVVSGSDGWNFQVRYTNPFDSLSRKVRGMLYEVEKPDGEKDDLGQTRYYPMGQIYASLLSYLAKNMQDSDAFMQVDHSNEGQDKWGNDINETSYPNGYPTFPVLEQMSEVYPWVRQIISRLTDDYLNPDWNSSLRYPSTGGAMASQFYTNFRKAYIPYGKIQIGINPETGKPYDSITPLNYQMEERVQRDKLEANYNNRMILTDHSIYNSDGTVNKENAKWLKVQLHALTQSIDEYIDYPEKIAVYENTPEEAEIMADDVNRYNRTIDLIRKVLQSYGIDATQDSVVSYMMMDEGDTIKKIFGDLAVVADKILKVADDKIADFNYMIDVKDNRGNKIWEHFFDNRGLITDASYMQSFYDSASKKTKYSYSADNYLMKVFRGVSMGTLDERRQYIDEHFGKYEWFRSQTAKRGAG